MPCVRPARLTAIRLHSVLLALATGSACSAPASAVILNTGVYEVVHDSLSGAQVTVTDGGIKDDGDLTLSAKGSEAIKPTQGFARLTVDGVARGSSGGRTLHAKAEVRAVAEPAENHTDFWTSITMSNTMTARLIDEVTPSSPGATDTGFVRFTWELSGRHQVGRRHIAGRNQGFYEVDGIKARTTFTSSQGGTLFEATLEPAAALLPLRDEFDLPKDYPPPPLGPIVVEVPVQFNQKSPIGFTLSSSASLTMTNLDGGDNFDVLAHADFGNSASLTLVEVLDAQRQVLPNATLLSESGIDYLGAIVPEPTHGWLGVIGVLSFRRRRQRPR